MERKKTIYLITSTHTNDEKGQIHYYKDIKKQLLFFVKYYFVVIVYTQIETITI